MKGRRYLQVAVLAMLCSFCVIGCETEDPDKGWREANIYGLLIEALYEANRCGPPQNPAQEIEVNTEYVFGGSVCLAVTTGGPAEIRIISSGNEGGTIVIYDKTGDDIDRVSEFSGSTVSYNLSEAWDDLRFRSDAGKYIDYRLEVIE